MRQRAWSLLLGKLRIERKTNEKSKDRQKLCEQEGILFLFLSLRHFTVSLNIESSAKSHLPRKSADITMSRNFRIEFISDVNSYAT